VDIMQARDIMTRPVITFRPDTPVRDAAAVLTEHAITAAPVVDGVDELVGIVSEADLIAGRFGHDPRSHLRRDGAPDDEPGTAAQTVGEVMTRTVIAMSASADAADLAHAMVDNDVRSIPIVAGASVVGIVSRRDLLKTLVRDDDIIRVDVAHRLETYTSGRTRWEVDVREGRVDIYGDIDDEAEARVLDILARTAPGVTHVDLHRTLQQPMTSATW
jgi:CBS domain-containing protein